MHHVEIAGTGSFLPRQLLNNMQMYSKISNFDPDKARVSLQKKNIDTAKLSDEEVFNEWVMQVSGIESRHFISAEDNFTPYYEVEEMACRAADSAINEAGIDKNQVESIIFTTFSSKTLIPNPSCTLAHLLGIGKAGGITLNTACSGFIDGFMDAYAKIASGIYNTILVASSEYISKELSFSDPTTSILFGDGAAAVVLKKSDKPGILSLHSRAEYSSEHILLRAGEKIQMGGGPLVQRNAVNAMFDSAMEVCNKIKMQFTDFDFIIPHQANMRIIKELGKKMKVQYEKVVKIIKSVGNTSCASIPITLDLLRKNKIADCVFTPGSKILCTSVGGGYTFGAAAFTA
ncbi:MAG: hypothetical protein A2096_11945 [Spirochaetes bacterium GWF1_41_5]|nr:MAG: hypothetical protein A2096_11945 [Spirochaetes bacterium GWF1_41_5]HBE02790.1 hypothetical protein [Spirochaetia bacterium]